MTGITRNEGGIERWLRACRCSRFGTARMLPAKRVFCPEPASRWTLMCGLCGTKRCWRTVAASLTELFAPKIHAARIEGLLANYEFADDRSLSYFRNRLNEAPKDVAFGVGLGSGTCRHGRKAGCGSSGVDLQNRRVVVAVGCPARGLCGNPHARRRALGCRGRFSPNAQQRLHTPDPARRAVAS